MDLDAYLLRILPSHRVAKGDEATMTNQQGNGATAPSIAPVIQFATALKGARPFKFHNVSDTYLAPILLADGSQRQSYLKDLPPKELQCWLR